MTIREIVLAGSGRAGSNGSWRCETNSVDSTPVCTLWHYSHCMLEWNRDNPNDGKYLYVSTGWGSVSDQGGMNQAFRALGIPLKFSRAGGADITEVGSPCAS